MTSPTTTREVLPPEAYDFDLILAFRATPTFDEFSDWMTSELDALESKWQHASSPKAWCGDESPRSSRG